MSQLEVPIYFTCIYLPNAFGADPGAQAEEYDREWGLVNYFSER